MQQIQTYLLSTAPTQAIRSTLQSFLTPSTPAAGAKPVSLGLLIHERVINTPTELLPHFHTALADDIAWAAKNDENKTNYQYTHFLLISRCVLESGRLAGGAGGAAVGAGGKKNKQKKAKSSAAGHTDMQTILSDAMFPRFEDQFYAQNASTLYFPRDSTESKGHSVHGSTQRVVMIFPASAVMKVAQRLTDVLGSETIADDAAGGDGADDS